MKKILLFSSIFVLVFTAILSFKTEKKIIIIDAGHGGEDHGATFNQISEKDIVQEIANNIKAWNKDENVEIILTRENDNYISFPDRFKIIRSVNPEMVLSLHINSSPKPNSNISTEIYTQEKEASKNLANKLSKSFGDCPIKQKNLMILRNSEAPAILLELGNIKNENEFNYMNSETGKQEISRKILKFIDEI